MDKQISDMQEMIKILAQYKTLYLKNPTQAEITSILRQRKETRNAAPVQTQTLQSLFN